MQSVDVLEYIDKDVLNKHKKSISNGEDKVIFENDNIKITLKKRGRKTFIFIDEYGTRSVNSALNAMVKLV